MSADAGGAYEARRQQFAPRQAVPVVDTRQPIERIARELAEIRAADSRAWPAFFPERPGIAGEVSEFLGQQREKLYKFGALPGPWQRTMLRRAGGAGTETLQDLYTSLSPVPMVSRKASILLKAGNVEWEAKRRRRRVPEWAASILRDPSFLQAECEDHEADEHWFDCLRFQPLALSICSMVDAMAHIPPSKLRLLTASDEELLEQAKDVVAQRLAINKQNKKKGEARKFHPRECDPASVRRRLRRDVSQIAIWGAAAIQMIGGPPERRLPRFADDWSTGRWRERKRQAAAFFDSMEIEGPEGLRLPLADVVESARKARMSSWYAMLLGLEDQAAKRGMCAVFVTATLPPRFHPHPRLGDGSYDCSLSPVAARDELSQRWRRVRAILRKRGIRYFGLRVVEPHSDGCPHAHFLLWVDLEHLEQLEDAFRRHFPAEGGDADVALKLKRWEAEGSARPQTYVMKYVLKHAEGGRDIEIEEDNEDARREAEQSARIGTWAAGIGVRRVSLVGLRKGAIGMWRAAYRSTATWRNGGPPPSCPRSRSVARAMRRGKWGTALALLGAFEKEDRFTPLREKTENRWGELVTITTGWTNPRTGEVAFLKRPLKWRLVPKVDNKETGATGVELESARTSDSLDESKVAIRVSYPRVNAAPAGSSADPPHPPPDRT